MDLFYVLLVNILEEVKYQYDYFTHGLQLDSLINRYKKKEPSQTINKHLVQLKESSHVEEIVTYVSKKDLYMWNISRSNRQLISSNMKSK